MALYKDLLGHNLEKFGMVTVFDATFYDMDDRPVLTLDTLTVSNITTESSQKEIRGGQGAELLLTYDYGRTANVEITDALASMYSLKYLWGAQLHDGDVEALVKRDYDITTAGKITVLETPATTKATYILRKKNGTQIYNDESTFATVGEAPNQTISKDLTITGGEVGDKVTVYFKALYVQGTAGDVTKSHIHQLTLTSDDFPKIMKLVGETFLIDTTTGKKVAMQIEIPKFKPNASFTFTLEAEGEASVFDFAGQAFSHNGEIVKLKTLGYLDADTDFTNNEDQDSEGFNPEESEANPNGE